MYSGDSGLAKDLIANLEELGVSPENIGFANVTMNSENFICIRENKHAQKSTLKIVDLRNGTEASDKPMTADSVIMNPNKSHLALRAQNTIQVFDVDSKTKIASLQVGFEVIFWTWIDADTLLLISEDFIYRWNYEASESIPMKWFEKSSSLADCQIINAEIDKTSTWCFLSGISLKNGKIEGTIQLFNGEKKVSQVIEGHAGNFFTLKSDCSPELDIFAFAARTKITDLKIHLIQINSKDSTPHFSKKVVDLPLENIPENDFPIRVVYDTSFGLVFVYTKFGFVFVIEPQSGTCVFHEKYSDSPIFLVTPSYKGSNHFVLNRKGDIYQAGIHVEPFFSSCIKKGIDIYKSVGMFMNNLPVSEQAEIYRNQFDKLKNSELYLEAILLVSKSQKPFLRTFEYLSSIKDFPNINETSALLEYFALILEEGKLNEVESLELVQLALNKKKLEIVRKWLEADQLYCTPQLGKVVLETDSDLALRIFEKAASEPMIIYCLAIMGKFEEFIEKLKSASSIVDFKAIFSTLLKTKVDLIPDFITSIITVDPSYIGEELLHEVFNSDLASLESVIAELFANQPEVLSNINSEEINTRIATILIKIDAEKFTRFIKLCEENNLKLDKNSILPLLKDVKMNDALFCFETNLDECLKLAASMCGKEQNIKSTNLSPSDVKKFIFTIIEDDPKKYGKLAGKMGEFIRKDDFIEIKNLLKSKVDDGTFLDFLIFWSGSDDGNSNNVTDDILLSAIRLGDENRLADICEKIKLSDPDTAFVKLSAFNYKSKSLKILAAKYNLHLKIISLFESKSEIQDAKEYSNFIGQDIFWSNVGNLIDNGISDSFLKPLLSQPDTTECIITTGHELEKRDKLAIISEIVLKSSQELANIPALMALKLKILSESDGSAFLEMIKNADLGKYLGEILSYCEKKNPNLALKYYLSADRHDEVLRLSFDLGEFDDLVLHLINQKNIDLWSKALNHKNFPDLVQKIIEKSEFFCDTESASCLIKVLVGKENYNALIKIMESWLKSNDKLKSSRSLQTLYLITVIKNNGNEAESWALKLDNYNVEEVLNTTINHKDLNLSLKILEKFEQWNYAFKIALYGLKDLEIAEKIASKSGHSEAWHALAEFSLISNDAISAFNYAAKAGTFRRQKELIILLHLNGNYKELLEYLLFLKSKPNYEPIYEREMFFCLVKLGKHEELGKFIGSANSSFANELGKILFREGSLDLAAKCFKQAENFEKASSCFLQLNELESASEMAIKSNKFEVWLNIIKFSLHQNNFDIARKFGLKCSQQPGHIQELFSIFEDYAAYDILTETIDVILDSSAPNQETMSIIGEIYCRLFTDKLESFINKYYSAVPMSFIQILANYRRWKECFKFYLLRSNLDEALELVIKHPSIEFDHHKLTAVITKIKNQKILSNLLEYYFECNPRMLMNLLDEFSERLDMSALIKFFKDRDILFVLDKTLRRYQIQNPSNIVVSSALNEHLIQVNDYYGLIESIKKCPSIDASAISESLKSSNQRHFRILAAKLMANSGEFAKSLSILVEEDALIETLMILSQSSNNQYAEAILSRYSRIRNAVMFVAVAYVLYDLLRPDVIFELAQRSEFHELSLPIFCQIMRHKLK